MSWTPSISYSFLRILSRFSLSTVSRASTSPAILNIFETGISFIFSYTWILLTGDTLRSMKAGVVETPRALKPFSVTSTKPRPVRM